MTPEAVTHKDVVSGVLGAGSALTGLALVFLGFAISTLQSYGGETPERVLTRHRLGVWILLAGLVAGIATVIATMGWLLSAGNDGWYEPGIWLFLGELVATLVGSSLVVLAILKR